MTSAPRTPRQNRSAGVTLVELMIVLVVIAIGILALSGVQTRSSTDVYKTGRRTRALAVAQTQLEVKKSLGYALAAPDSGVTDGFNWEVEVTPVNPTLNQLTVQVTWSEKGTPDSLQLIDMVAAR